VRAVQASFVLVVPLSNFRLNRCAVRGLLGSVYIPSGALNVQVHKNPCPTLLGMPGGGRAHNGRVTYGR
jgi:hypothetical protein